ncbi:uncharacterized protein LOC143176947 [Calliopsis andreniformis]|uniref:uncharacterized protein LOC143176947 n=1 Tax=Calliopsis andreniformis TaxID=337506 RepID=UPI003FCE80AA
MEKDDDAPEDVKRATSIEREIRRGEKDDTFEGYPRQTEKKKRWEHCDKSSSKKQKGKSNGDCCEKRRDKRKKSVKFVNVAVFGEPCTFPKAEIIPRHCLTKTDYINMLATPSRKCPPDCYKQTTLRKLKPVSPRIKELAQPTKQRILMTLQQTAGILPPALLDNLVRTLEDETCLTPEQAAIASRRKFEKKKKKKKGKRKDDWSYKERSKSKKLILGTVSGTGSFDRDAVSCQYLIAERFVKSILKWKCPIPKSEFSDVSEVIIRRLIDILEYTRPHNEDRKSQQLRFLADVIACWVSGVLSEVAQDQEKKLEERCKKKEAEMKAEEEEEEDEDEDDEDKDDDLKIDDKETRDEEDEDERDKIEDEETEEKIEEEAEDIEKEEIGVETEQVEPKEEVEEEVQTQELELDIAETKSKIESEEQETTDIGTEMQEEPKVEVGVETITEPGIEVETEAKLETEGEALEGEDGEGVPETEAAAEAEVKDEGIADIKTEETPDEPTKDLLTDEATEESEKVITEEDEGKDMLAEEEMPPAEKEEMEVEAEKVDKVAEEASEKTVRTDKIIPEDLEELFKSDLPFLTFGKIIDTVYKMIENVPENTGEDPITNGIHRVIYEKLSNIVMLENPDLLTEELKDVMDVVCGKIANWLRSILSKSQIAFMERYVPVVESKEIRDWTKWLAHISDAAIDWNIWLRSVIEKIFEMEGTQITRGEWKDWTKSVDTGALLWRRFHLQTIHQAHRNVTMMIGRRVVKTGTAKTPFNPSEQLIQATDLQA